MSDYIRKFLEESIDFDSYDDVNQLSDDTDCDDCNDNDISDMTEDEISQQIDDLLQEVSASTVRMSKRRKIRAAAGLASLRAAKKRNDPAYDKYKKFRKRALAAKKKLMKRYGSRGMRSARKSMK